VQTKLAVSQSGDIYEQEADRIADQVLAKPAHPDVISAPPRIQRYTGQATGQGDIAPASVDHVLAGSGRPLEPALRQDMEQRFGHDFSRVRVHSGAAAEQSAQDVNAHAYTVGHNVVFGAGRFAPETHEGQRLIAHELTHVVQQSGAEGVRFGQSNVKRGLSPVCQQQGGDTGTVVQRKPIPVTGYKARVRELKDVPQDALDITQQTETRLCTTPDNDYTDTNCPKASLLAPGTQVTVTHRNTQGGWLFVEAPPIKALGGQKYGWVIEAFVEPVPKAVTPPPTVTPPPSPPPAPPPRPRRCDDMDRPIDDSEQVYICTRGAAGEDNPVHHAYFRIGSTKTKCGPTYSLFPNNWTTAGCIQGAPEKDQDIEEGGTCVAAPITWSCVHREALNYPWGRYCLLGPNSNTFVRVIRDACGDTTTKPAEGWHPGFDSSKPEAGLGTQESVFGEWLSSYNCEEIDCGTPTYGFK
jgi:hypothetical protein